MEVGTRVFSLRIEAPYMYESGLNEKAVRKYLTVDRISNTY
jgi:hypothetical protein